MPETPKHPAHWCALDHEPIWHSDSDNEPCPLCRRIAEITRLREQVEESKGQQVVANQSVFGIRNIRPYYSTLIEYNESPSQWGVAGPDSYQVCVFGGKEHHKVMAEECAARMNTAVERFYNKPYPQPSEQRITVEQAMEAAKEWCEKDGVPNFGEPSSVSKAWKFDALRARLSKLTQR